MKKTFLSGVVFCLMAMALTAQDHNTVEFRYDDSGNRILRHTIFLAPTVIKGAAADTLQEEPDDKNQPADEVVILEKTIRIFPNPTRGDFTVNINYLTDDDKVNYSLYSVTGQIISEGVIAGSETKVSLADYQNGTYFFKLKVNSDSNTWTIIKR